MDAPLLNILHSMHLEIAPRPKESVRVFRGHGILPAKTRKYMNDLTILIKAGRNGLATIEAPVYLEIVFNIAKPKSVTRLLPCVGFDVDNACKGFLDSATNAGLWKDDSQVVTLFAQKRYTNGPGSIDMAIGVY